MRFVPNRVALSTNSTIVPRQKPAILFNERSMALLDTREDAYGKKRNFARYDFSCLANGLSNDGVGVARGALHLRRNVRVEMVSKPTISTNE